MLVGVLRLHDAVTRLTFWMAAAAVAYLTVVTAVEVGARYLFRAPSGWAPDTTAVSFAFIAFLAAPEVTRQSGHAAMTFIVERSTPVVASLLRRLSLALSILVCLLLAWYGLMESARQIQGNITMIAVLPIPKWIVTLSIVYGLTGMALYFLRSLVGTFRPVHGKGNR